MQQFLFSLSIPVLLAGAAVMLAAAPSAQALSIQPTSSFTARLIAGMNVLVADASGQEGTQFNSAFLAIKQTTEDRTVLEYDLAGLSTSGTVTLDFSTSSLDDPLFSQLSLWAFEGNGLVNAADFFRVDTFVTNFTDNGVDPSTFSLDVTSVFNSFVTSGKSFLGFVMRADDPNARYVVALRPTLEVPEPTTALLLACALVGLGVRRRLH